MNFDLSEDQRAIQRTARELLAARYPPEEVRRLALETELAFTEEQWAEMVALGWPALGHEEGLGMVELAVVAEELGYALAPTPLQTTWAAAAILAAAGETEWLPRLVAGEARGTAALYRDDEEHCIVPDAGSADVIVLGQRMLTRSEASMERVESFDPTRRLYRVRDDGGVPQPEGDGDPMPAILVMLAADSVGIAQRAMEMAVAHAAERKQFGRAIGTNQAVSHRCAQMLLEVEGARSLVLNAAWALDHEPSHAALDAAMAKAYASDAGVRVASSSIQVHGGIGFTWEHDLHFFLKRAQANAQALGSARVQRERVASLVL